MDNGQGRISVLVDFSAACNTINHDILIRRLRLRYGFVGKPLDLMISYLQERTQQVVIGGQSSSTTTLTAGVPQGSVLLPLLFSFFYVQPISDIIRAHGLFSHRYVDDLQIYSHFDQNPSALAAVVQKMEDCLDDIKHGYDSRCVRNLGVFVDSHLDMKKQVPQTFNACSVYFCHANQISRFLPKLTKERVVNAIITSRLDYNNSYY